MKKTLKFLPLLLLAILFGFSVSSCSEGSTEEEPTVVTRLPQQAQTFLNSYFQGYEIVKVTQNNDNPVWYEVQFRGGGEVKFDAQGLWWEVEGDNNRAVPVGFYPSTIDTYVSTNYSGAYIHEIDRVTKGFEVDLNNDVDLVFDAQGNFLQIKR